MATFLAFLFLGLIITLVIGLIKPFRFYPGQISPPRKKFGLVFGSLIILTFISFGIVNPSPSNKVAGESTTISVPIQIPSPSVYIVPIVTQTPVSPMIDIQNQNTTLSLVTRVVDGDTIEIDGGTKVRLIGIDAPESVDPNRPVGCYGTEANNFTKAQLQGKEVKLEKDVSETDKYGRLLRYVWLGDSLFNETLVKEGYAQSSTYPPDVKYQDKFIAVQTEARNSKKGLWGAVCDATPKPATSIPKPTNAATQNFTNTSGGGSCKYSCSSPDRDCSDFSSHTEAQAFFNCCGFSAGNDPMRLDKANGQGDGLACESL